MSRPFIESIVNSCVQPYAHYKSIHGDWFSAHTARRQDALVAAAKSAVTVEQLREVVLEHPIPKS